MTLISRPSFILCIKYTYNTSASTFYLRWTADGQTDPHRQLFSFPIHFCCIRLFQQHVGGEKGLSPVVLWLVVVCLQVWLIGNHQGRYRWIGLPAAPSGRFRPRHWNVQPPNRFSLLISIFVFLCPCGFCSFMMAVFFPLPTVIEAFVTHLNLLMHL